jgi:hypothetical protein
MLRFRGFFGNDAPDASLPKNASASLHALATLLASLSFLQQHQVMKCSINIPKSSQKCFTFCLVVKHKL